MLCAHDVDVVPRGRVGHLRVALIDVITALSQAAISEARARNGVDCTPPSRGDGIGEPWRCPLSYQAPPAQTVTYRLTVRAGGCWSATPVLAGSYERGVARAYDGCGLRVAAATG